MKELLILVGPQGAGKSTYCQEIYDTHYRISQDDQGKEGHYRLFLEKLEHGATIVIDRINHTREQRSRYIEPAKTAGYTIRIKTMNIPYGVCFDRIKNRVYHPTLGQDAGTDDDTIQKALGMYFKQYERPTKDEADVVEYSEYDPYLLDLTGKYEQAIIVGDLHGCYEELWELLRAFKYDVWDDKTCLILCGDVVDRGPDIYKCLKLLDLPHVYSVRGNHEDKFIRWLRGNKVTVNHGLQSTLDQLGLLKPGNERFVSQELQFTLESLPYMIKFGTNVVLHAGINPKYPIERQNKEVLIYLRTLGNSMNDPCGKNWFEDYDGGEEGINIYFGHDYHEKCEVNDYTWSMDGHCVHGKELRGVLVDENDPIGLIKIPSKQPIQKDEEPLKYHPSLKIYEKLVEGGYLRKSEMDDLVLYGYTDQCTFERYWNEYTTVARGIIFEKHTGKLIAKPFPKFFNLGEMPETQLQNLPNEPYECFEKVDGSLGIVFHHKGEWKISTRGSFFSEQAKKGAELLKNYDLTDVPENFTLLVEIIYPENKIIVDYGKEEKLILLGAYDRNTGTEVEFDSLPYWLPDMELTPKYNHSIGQMIDLQKTMPKDQEGFVVRFDSGLRVKFKSEEYLKLAKLISRLTPIGLWETMQNGKVDQKALQELPEEFSTQYEEIQVVLENQYQIVLNEIKQTIEKTPVSELKSNEDRKTLGLWIKANSDVKHSGVVFPFLLGNNESIERYIMKEIRPTGNQLKEIE